MKNVCGVSVRYCGHKASFVADITVVGEAVVVRHDGPVTMENVDRSVKSFNAAPFHLMDFPSAGFWRPDLGVFVVPKSQFKKAS